MLLVLTNVGYTERGYYIEAKEVVVIDVDMQNKTISYLENKKEITKKFRMELLQDVYYKSTTEKYNLNQMPLNKKYHLMIRYVSEDDYKASNPNLKGELYYIGTVPYPF